MSQEQGNPWQKLFAGSAVGSDHFEAFVVGWIAEESALNARQHAERAAMCTEDAEQVAKIGLDYRPHELESVFHAAASRLLQSEGIATLGDFISDEVPALRLMPALKSEWERLGGS